VRASRRYVDSLRRLRQANPGQIPAERPGKDVARGLRPLLRLSRPPDGQVLFQGIKTVLPERLLQVNGTRRRAGRALCVCVLCLSLGARLLTFLR
jgi:hypothetical protein